MTVSLGDIVAHLQVNLVQIGEVATSLSVARSRAESLLQETSAMELDGLSAQLDALIEQIDHFIGRATQLSTAAANLIDLAVSTGARTSSATNARLRSQPRSVPEKSGVQEPGSWSGSRIPSPYSRPRNE